MGKKWEYHTAFMYSGDSYITWIRPGYINEDGSYHFETKVEKATKTEIKEAQSTNNVFKIL
jgi:hypothetical protein